MKSNEIEYKLKDLEVRLKKIARRNVSGFAQKTGLKQSDVSSWLNFRRSFSYKKLLSIAKKLEE